MHRPVPPSGYAVAGWLLPSLPLATLFWLRVFAARLITRQSSKENNPGPATIPAAATHPGISLIIIAWNGWPMTRDLLTSIRQQTVKPDEVILIDDHSTDGIAEKTACEFPEVQVIRLPENRGFAAAANAGLQAAGGNTLVLLNNDLELAPDFTAQVQAALARYPGDASFAVQLRYTTEPERLNAAGEIFYSSLLPDNRQRGEPLSAATADTPVAGACAAAAIYRRELLAAIGGFDDDFVMIYEDSDLSLRALLAGYTCHYIAGAVAWHRQQASIGAGSARSVFYTVKNSWHLLTKHLSAVLLARQALPAIAHRAWLMANYMAGGQIRAALTGYAAAWRETAGMAAKSWNAPLTAGHLRPWLHPLPRHRRSEVRSATGSPR